MIDRKIERERELYLNIHICAYVYIKPKEGKNEGRACTAAGIHILSTTC